MRARIYSPSRTAMQSGTARTGYWLMEFEPESPRQSDPLMGWTGTVDTQTQVRLRFPTREAAIAYAGQHGYDYDVLEVHQRIVRPKSYAANFK